MAPSKIVDGAYFFIVLLKRTSVHGWCLTPLNDTSLKMGGGVDGF